MQSHSCNWFKKAVAPEGWEETVKKMKKHPEINNPWALSWYMKNKGDVPAKKSSLDVEKSFLQTVAGLSTQVRNMKKRLRDMDTSKCSPSEVRDIVDALESLEKRLDAEKERKQKRQDEKDSASEEADIVEAAYEGKGGPGKTFPNTPGDEASIRELTLWADNTSEIYGQKESIIKNIARRIKNGTYDPSLAPKLWRYWFDSASQSYNKEFGYSFPPAIRQKAAEAYAPDEYEMIMNGEYSTLLGDLSPKQQEGSLDTKADEVPPQPPQESAASGMKWTFNPQTKQWSQTPESEQTVPMQTTTASLKDEYSLFS